MTGPVTRTLTRAVSPVIHRPANPAVIAGQAWRTWLARPQRAGWFVGVVLWVSGGAWFWQAAVPLHLILPFIAWILTRHFGAYAVRHATGVLWVTAGFIGHVAGGAAWWERILGLACGVLLVVVTDRHRARTAHLRRVRQSITNILPATHTARDPRRIRVTGTRWQDRRTLVTATFRYPTSWAASVSTSRDKVTEAIDFMLDTDTADYDTVWHPEGFAVTVTRHAVLPTLVAHRRWHTDPVTRDTTPALPVMGVTTPTRANPTGVVTWQWDTHPFMLVVGQNNSGKTVFTRSLVTDALTLPGVTVDIIDGKGEGDYAALSHRAGVTSVAHNPDEWMRTLTRVHAEAEDFHRQVLAWRQGDGAKPDMPHRVLVLDEVQRVVLADPSAADLLSDLARTARSTNFHLVIITQRPDVRDTIPGAVRDQLHIRVVFNRMSPEGARMALGPMWRAAATSEAGAGRPLPKGRAVVLTDQTVIELQAPYLADPVEDPDAEQFLPAREERPAPTRTTPTRDDPPWDTDEDQDDDEEVITEPDDGPRFDRPGGGAQIRQIKIE
jgi:hypothetical protein